MNNAGIDLYHLLHARGLTHSKRHFSREWLGAAENYACLRGSRGPSEGAVLHLLRRLILERRYILAAYVARQLLWPDAPNQPLRGPR